MSETENNVAQEPEKVTDESKEEPKPEKKEDVTSEEEAMEEDGEDKEDVKAEDKKEDKKEETPKKEKKTPKKKKKEEVEEDEDDEDDEEPKLGLLEQPVVIEGGRKREKRKVERLDVSAAATPKDRSHEIEEGTGEKLGELPRVEFHLAKTLSEDLKPLHRVLFGRPGSANEVKKNIRKFSGFNFKEGSPEYEKKVGVLNKFTLSMLKSVCEVLDIERGGTKEAIVSRIMEFLLSPKSSGKAVPKPKRKSSAKKEGKGKKRKRESGDKKKKKSKEDVSDDDDDDDDDDDNEDEDDDDNEEDEEEDKDSEEEEAPAKKAKTEPKKKPEKKDEKKETKKTEAKKSEAKKPAPAKKVVDSSDDDDSSEDDEPLVKKKPPTDDELKEVIKKILDGANLEEVTMKTVCKKVYAKYPDYDLSDRKDFIKSTVKQIIR